MDAGDKARQRVAKVEAIGKLIDEYHLKVQGRLPHPRDSLAQPGYAFFRLAVCSCRLDLEEW